MKTLDGFAWASAPQKPDATAGADDAPGFARRAEALHLHGDTGGALRILTAGARRHPGDVIARLILARVCRDGGRMDEAREWLEAALRADPECPAALLQLSEMPASAPGGARDVPRRDACRERLAAQEPWDEGFRASARSLHGAPAPTGPDPEPRGARAEHPPTFTFPVREEEEDPEIDEESPPRIATVTLAEIYFQQGLKEQAAQIYRQLLERQPGDASVNKRLGEIEASMAEPG